MAVFGLVRAGFRGGWCWRRIVPHLRAGGHEVYTPTLNDPPDFAGNSMCK
jgi:hypothetical protein